MSSLYKQRQSRFWWIKFRDADGVIRRQSLRTAHRQKALAMQKIINRQVKSNKKPQSPKTLEEWQAAYLNEIKGNVGSRHYDDTKSRLHVAVDMLSISDAAQITQEGTQALVTTLNAHGKAPSTIKGYIVALRGFCAFLERKGAILLNPCHDIKLPKIRKLPPRFLREDEYQQALEVAKEHKIYLEVLTGLKTGMRMSEIRFMEWPDIHWQQKIIVVPRTKSNRPRTIPLHPELLSQLSKIARKTGPVFRGAKGGYVGHKQWRDLLKPLQDAIPAFRHNHKGTGTAWHMLRHTWATRLAMAGVPLPKLQAWAGHRDIKTTMRYATYSPDHYDKDIELV